MQPLIPAIVALVTLTVTGNPALAADAPALFTKYCYSCHGEGEKSGQIALDEMLKADPATTNRREWEKAWKIVRHEFMPPVDVDHPTPDERKAIIRWIEKSALGVDHQNPDPGRVTMRRLNRIEYEYSMTDLFGVNVTSAQQAFSLDNKGVNTANKPLRDRLPPDDNTFGFDNNGDFMTLSPALLERYLNLAEWIVDQVIVQNGPRHPMRDLLDPRPKAKVDAETRGVELTVPFELAHSGPYKLEIRFSVGEFAEVSGVFEMVLLVDGQQIRREEIGIGGHATHIFSHDLNLEKGKHTWTYLSKPFDSVALSKKASREKPNVMNPYMHVRLTGPIGTGVYEYPDSHKRVFFNGPAPSASDERRAYAKAIIKRLADRAFRRPTDDPALERLTDIAVANDNFEAGVGQAISGIIASPRFLFRAELQPSPDDPKAIHVIDEYALASRLSYMLWLSIPDEELQRLAGEGKLRENLEPQLRRMLADKKSSRFFEDFPGQWLRTRNVLMTPNSRQGGVLDPLRPAMKRETEMLFEHIVRNDRDLLELVTADYTFVNKALAEFYEIKGVEGEGFEKVSLSPDSHRGGMLTHSSFLVSTSNPNRTSPVKRGLYVLDTFWGIEPPPPVPNIPSLEDAKVNGVTPRTVREQLAAHRADAACAACHAHFDPIGVALENYDLIGRWRSAEEGQKIEPKEETTTGEVLTGVDDIRKLFASRPEKFYRGVTAKLMTYALGRGLQPSDAAVVDGIADELAVNQGKFSTLLLGIVQSPEFQKRRGDDGVPPEPPRIVKQVPPKPETLQAQRERRRAARMAARAAEAATTAPAKPTTTSATQAP